MQTEVLRGGGYWYVGDKSPVLEEFRNEMQIYERMSYMTMLRSEAFRDMPAALWRFEAAAVTTPQLEKARGYAQNWDEFKKSGDRAAPVRECRHGKILCRWLHCQRSD